MMPGPSITVKARAGERILVGGFTLIPLARSVRAQLPSVPGGLIWTHPVAVAVQTGDGVERMLPVRDATRQAQWTLLTLGGIGSLLIWLALRRKSYG